jgi:hypothetical protein
MEVVEGMPVSGKAKPATWEEARTGFKPAELVRGKRSLTVEYRHHSSHWTATSSDLDGFEVSASTLPQLKIAARAILDDWLDPAVQVSVVEIDDAQSPMTRKSKRRTSIPSRWTSARTVVDALRSKRQRKTGRSVSKKG